MELAVTFYEMGLFGTEFAFFIVGISDMPLVGGLQRSRVTFKLLSSSEKSGTKRKLSSFDARRSPVR